jgi:hypothetical protein
MLAIAVSLIAASVIIAIPSAHAYSFTGTSVTYSGKGLDVDITVECTDSQVKWTFDFPIDDDAGNGSMGYALVISYDQVHPKFQIHNNDGTCAAFPWGTHLYSPWDPELGGYNGWHSWEEAWNTRVSDMDWISCSGERRRYPDNPDGIFTVTIDKCKLAKPFYWAVHFGATGFWNYGGLSKYPEAWEPWSGDASDFETASIKPCKLQVYVDIKPGSWPNPINKRSRGVFTVAICGTEDFDVTTIDPATIEITIEGLEVGVSPVGWSYEDAATPYTGEPGGGHDLEGDGYLDLVLKFDTQEVVNTLELCQYNGEKIPLIISGNLCEEFDGTPIQGEDYVRIFMPSAMTRKR